MNAGLIKIDWNNVNDYSEEEISYFLFLEGKSIDAISRIRKIDKAVIQKHIIDGKIKYRFLVKSKDAEELFNMICKAGKQDKIALLNSLDEYNSSKLIDFIKVNYADMGPKNKESAVWILGELKEKSALDILIRASVHKFVNIRRLAISAMGKIGDKKAESALIRALEDENSQVVSYAIKSLLKINSTNAIEKIKNLYSYSEKIYVKRAAKEYLEAYEEEN